MADFQHIECKNQWKTSLNREISHSISESGSRNRTVVSDFTQVVHKRERERERERERVYFPHSNNT